MNTYLKSKYNIGFVLGGATLLLFYLAAMQKGINPRNLFVLTFGGVIGLLGLIFIWHKWWKGAHRFHVAVSLLIISSFIGAAVPLFKVAGFTIYPFRILLGLCVFMLAGFFYYRNQTIIHSLKSLKDNSYTYLGLFWIFYAVLSLAWSVNTMNTIQDIIFLLSGLLTIYFILLVYKNKKDYEELFFYWIVMSLLLIAIGLINHFLQIHLPVSRINTVAQYQKHIPTAVFTNENDFASFLAIASFFFLSLLKNGKVLLYKAVGATGFLLSIYLIGAASSRANYIAIAIGLVVWFIFVLKPLQRLKMVIIGTLLSAPVFIFMAERVAAGMEIVIGIIRTLLPAEGQEDSISIRENLLKNVKVFVENTYGFGVGPGNIELYMKKFQFYNTFGDYNVHNWWAEILVHYGVLTFTGYVVLLVYLFVQLIKIVKKCTLRSERMMAESLLCGLSAFALASISPNSFMALHYNWLFIGVCIGFVYMKTKGEDVRAKTNGFVNHSQT
ncbi:O-antigen ligase family protein [Bacillus sp. Marseille-Q1617]|uniref:O-antigen ligase family protein n=1 Tax=Bacillus sp. Marseille-Q1617 TaxID=2736887 RepID=UPI00158A8A7E|nr:O-antigen ligase family protein [Bacillus sp. Marseille-Q1617]